MIRYMNLLAFLYQATDDVNKNYKDYCAVMLIQSVYKKYKVKKIYKDKINSLRKIQLWWRKLSQKKIGKNSDSVVKIYTRRKKNIRNKKNKKQKVRM